MIIKCHRKLTVNLKLFLEKLGYECYYNRSFDNHDEILVTNCQDSNLLSRIEDYSEHWGFIPYHFSLKPRRKGNKHEGDKVSDKVRLVEMKEFEALQGNFQLILMDNEHNNYLWKTYTNQSIKDGQLELGAKLKAVIAGFNDEKINLISHCRIKEVEDVTRTNRSSTQRKKHNS